MTILKPSDVADLPVRKAWRNRPTDGYAWWLALTHEVPDECTITTETLLDMERRHGGKDVDLIINQDRGADGVTPFAEIVVWLEPKVAP